MKKGMILFALILASGVAMAASGGGHHDEGIPTKLIISQAVNLVLILAVLFFALREKVAAHFKTRASQYTELVQRAERDRLAAEEARREIENRLNNLVATSDQEMKRIRTEAEALKQKIVADAEGVSKKLEEDARASIAIEIEKAKANMRSEILMSALQKAETGLKGSIKAPEHHKLQQDFIQKMKVVN